MVVYSSDTGWVSRRGDWATLAVADRRVVVRNVGLAVDGVIYEGQRRANYLWRVSRVRVGFVRFVWGQGTAHTMADAKRKANAAIARLARGEPLRERGLVSALMDPGGGKSIGVECCTKAFSTPEAAEAHERRHTRRRRR